MNKVFFYATLLPSLIASLAVGAITQQKPVPLPVQEKPLEGILDCRVVEPIAQQVTYEFAEKYFFPVHVYQYVAKNMCNALNVEAKWGIPAAGVLAKAGSEHSFGTKGDKIERANNHFGIKCNEQYMAEYPHCIEADSWEMVPSKKRTDSFVKYNSAAQSYYHFGEFLATRQIGEFKPYVDVMSHLGNAEEFLVALAASSYSTNVDEETLTVGILRQFHLDEIVATVKAELPSHAYQPKHLHR